MTETLTALHLENRAIIGLSGPDAKTLLQGLITNDINKLNESTPLYAALLTPQGKYLFDFILFENAGRILVDCEATRKDDLVKRLTFYRLRADVKIEDLSDTHTVYAFSPTEDLREWTERSVYFDPRCKGLGGRGVFEDAPEGAEPWPLEAYENLRLSLGIPDGARDMEVDKRFILEANLDHLNGVDFEKGCYVGQEMTTRMNYRGTLKKRLLPATIEGPLPAPGMPFSANGKNAGEVLSGQGDRVMTLTRLEHLDAELKTEDGVVINPYRPDWLPKSD